MKKVYHILFTAVALFAFASVTSAQETPTRYNDLFSGLTFPQEKAAKVEAGVGFNKSISSPTSDGTYWIKLEAFATGEATYKVTNEPADIVLVLDFSQSMTNQYSTTSTYVPYVNNTYQNINQNGRYIFYEGEYRQLRIGRLQRNGQNVSFNQGGYAWAYFQIGTTTYYLDGYGNNAQIRVASDPTNMSDHPVWSGSGNFGNNTVMWSGVLYASDNNVSRLEALKVAVDNFIDVIYHNDNYDENENLRDEPLGNRISIVMFSTVAATEIVGNGWTDISTSSREKNTELLNAFIAVTNTPMQTHADEGMSKAITLLSQIDEDRMAEASRTVVLFTDGAPGENPSWTNPTSTTVANNTITNSKTVKTSYSATVFSVLVGNATGDMVTYMNAVTSNYPEATSLDNLGKVCTDSEYYSGEKEYLYKETADFYKNAGQDLSGVFEEIAHQSGGSSDTSLSSATSTVDIVSSSFMLPTDATADNIKVFTDKCTYGDKETGVYTFEGNGILADGRTDTYDKYNEDGELIATGVDVDNTINVTLGTKNGNPMIQVDGFDYSNLWCGKITDESGDVSYQGYKVIIMIPIKMNPDAVGGPNVGTNMPGSGIYIDPDDAEPHVEFDIPTVSLPVNVHLEKIGLKPGESAKFRIERAVIPDKANWDPETDIDGSAWTYVSTVFVTNSPNAKISKNGNPMVQVRGMPATITVDENHDGQPDKDEDGKIIQLGVVYRITEENWAWSYTILNTEEYPNPQYTVTSKVDNPFAFKNEPKDNIDVKIRHAESKATNIFKAVGEDEKNVRYDDSKKNVREDD